MQRARRDEEGIATASPREKKSTEKDIWGLTLGKENWRSPGAWEKRTGGEKIRHSHFARAGKK